eukprot:6195024-Pleurochrysis_carterae.AAC.1
MPSQATVNEPTYFTLFAYVEGNWPHGGVPVRADARSAPLLLLTPPSAAPLVPPLSSSARHPTQTLCPTPNPMPNPKPYAQPQTRCPPPLRPS